MGKMEKMEKSGREEEYLEGRRAGVEGTYGEKRRGLAEKTVFPHAEGVGGGEDGLPATASRLYKDAVENRGDKFGDKALTER